jgi:hypothetical protein
MIKVCFWVLWLEKIPLVASAQVVVFGKRWWSSCFFFFFVGDDAQVIVAAISLKDRSSNRYRSYHSSHFPLQESSPPS